MPKRPLPPARLLLVATVLLLGAAPGTAPRASPAVDPVAIRAAIARIDSARWCADVRQLSGADTVAGAVPRTRFLSRFLRCEYARPVAAWLRAQLATGGCVAALDSFWFRQNGDSTLCWNVVGEVRGDTRPGQVVLLAAHYDDICNGNDDPRVYAPGAEDNATGAATVLAAARALAGAHWGRTVRFVLFAAEEVAGAGSRDYAARRLAAGDTLTAAVVADMVSWHDGAPGFILDARSEHAWLAQLLAAQVRDYTGAADSVQLSPLGRVGSDQITLADAGIPAALVTGRDWRTYPYYHTIQDTWAHIEAKTTQGILATRVAVAALAALGDLHATGLSVAARDLTAVTRDGAVQLHWVTGDLPAGAGLALMRAADGTWRRLTPLPFVPPPGPTVWRDAPPAGVPARYRLDLLDADGTATALVGPVAAAGPAAPAAGPLLALEARGDPGTGTVTLTCAAAHPARATLRLYDLAGRARRELWRGWLEPAGLAVVWDGRDGRGRPVASGRYLARLAADGAWTTARVTLLR